jgi:hypothetical protein
MPNDTYDHLTNAMRVSYLDPTMAMTMKFLIPVLLLLMAQPLLSQDKIVEEYPEVFLRAAREQKSVIFVFCHPNCGWCRLFDKYHASPDVKDILDKEYLIWRIDISESESAMNLFEAYKLPGVPAWMIYNSNRELMSDGKYPNGDLVGYPIEPGGMEIYKEAIVMTSRYINEKQLGLLGEKLVYLESQ